MRLWMTRAEKGEAHVLLAGVLLAEYGMDVLPATARMEGGKPYFPAHPELHFNLSHSGGLVLCGVGAAELGVDLERVRPRRAGLPGYVLGREELAWFEARGSRWGDFYTLWTLKEARCKCTGTGLDGPPKQIAVPLLEVGQEERLDGLLFRAYGGHGWRAAVCCVPPEHPARAIQEKCVPIGGG